MASIKFFTQTDKYPATIYVRISLDRKNIYKKKTPLSAVESWSKEKGFDKGRDAKGKEINVTLKNLEAFITQQLNVSTSKNDVIDSLWLQNQIDKFFNKSIKSSDGIDYSILNNYLDYFINDKEKLFKQGLIQEGSLKKYKTIKNLLIDFQKYLKKQYRIIDVDRDFKDKFEDYAHDVIVHDTNTTGRTIKFIKEICNHARINKGIETSLDLDLYKGYSVKTPSVYLTFEELDKIESTEFKHDYLDNARDWLIVGCFTGQRISDLLQYSSKDIITIGDVELLQIKQKKTKKMFQFQSMKK